MAETELHEFHIIVNIEAPSREVAEEYMCDMVTSVERDDVTPGAMAVLDGDGLFPTKRSSSPALPVPPPETPENDNG
jgi:hypothetical protein